MEKIGWNHPEIQGEQGWIRPAPGRNGNRIFGICMIILVAVFFASVAIQCVVGPRTADAKHPTANRASVSHEARYP